MRKFGLANKFGVYGALTEEQTLAEAVSQAREEAHRYQQVGIDIEQFETAAKQLLMNGQFEDVTEEVPLMLEEFYPEPAVDIAPPTPAQPLARATRLTDKLGKQSSPELSVA